jgi:hypothetical protein
MSSEAIETLPALYLSGREVTAYRVNTPSFETRWLQRLAKDLPQAEVTYVSGLAVSGFMDYPSRSPLRAGNAEISRATGAIVINADAPSHEQTATLAHEWRHHWQVHRGWTLDGGALYARLMDLDLSDHERWGRYFTHSRSERDALSFELRVAPAPLAQEMLEAALAYQRRFAVAAP